ncbi:hypothetical protein G6514_004324 [Epicoccum nigrum]|nr:hypothetical protein G6514_004324 [Epicoccum nigrum]
MLRIGSDLKPYWVPEILLQSLKDLPRSESPEESIHLEDVDVETGHVIVHFLFTGNYQLLPVDRGNMDGTSPDTSKEEFEKAIAIFVTAKSYQLTGLQTLAREEAERIGKEISVELAAHAVGEDTLAVLNEDAAWLYSLVLRKAEQSFQEDHLLFSSVTFFDGIKSIALAKILGQHVSGWYCQRVLQLHKVLGPPHESVEKVVIHTSQDRHEEPINQPVETSPGKVNSFSAAEFAAQSGRDMAVSGVRVPDNSVAVERPNLEPLVETEIAQVNSERPAPNSIEKSCAFPLVAMPVMSKSAMNAHYIARTGPFVGLKKKERMQLKKMMRAQAAAVSEDTEPVKVAQVTDQQESATVTAFTPVIDEIVIPDSLAQLAKSEKKKKENHEAELKQDDIASDPEPGVSLQQAQHTDVPTNSYLIAPKSNSTVELGTWDNEQCAFRYDHLTQNSGWRDCKQCENYMRNIAVKLQSAGMPDVNALLVG